VVRKKEKYFINIGKTMAKRKSTANAEEIVAKSIYTLKADPTYDGFWSIFKGKKRIIRKRSKDTCEILLERLQLKEQARA
jgi:hypothetical protein